MDSEKILNQMIGIAGWIRRAQRKLKEEKLSEARLALSIAFLHAQGNVEKLMKEVELAAPVDP